MFITKPDFITAIYEETLTDITRADDTIIDSTVKSAIAEITSYLSPRFDCNAIFSATGSNRHELIKEFTIDIALYHIHCIHDPVMIPEIRVKRYDRAVSWLKEVKKQQLQPDLPTAHISKPETQYIHYGSNPKRNNHY